MKSEELLTYLFKKAHKAAWHTAHNHNNRLCEACGFYGCICQENLDQYVHIKAKIFREKCPYCGLFLCDCPRTAEGEKLKTLK